MNKISIAVAFVSFILLTLAGIGKLRAGQEIIIPVEQLVNRSHLIAVVNVTEVTPTDVALGEGQLATVYVAKAVVEETVKSDVTPVPRQRTIAMVGSTRPRSSAVWKPIEKRKYLAFLRAEQGHFVYEMNMAMRPIDAEENVAWVELLPGGPPQFSKVPLKKAIQRVSQLARSSADQANSAAAPAKKLATAVEAGDTKEPISPPEISIAKALELTQEQMKHWDLHQRFFIRSMVFQSTRDAAQQWMITITTRDPKEDRIDLRIRIYMDGSIHLIK